MFWLPVCDTCWFQLKGQSFPQTGAHSFQPAGGSGLSGTIFSCGWISVLLFDKVKSVQINTNLLHYIHNDTQILKSTELMVEFGNDTTISTSSIKHDSCSKMCPLTKHLPTTLSCPPSGFGCPFLLLLLLAGSLHVRVILQGVSHRLQNVLLRGKIRQIMWDTLKPKSAFSPLLKWSWMALRLRRQKKNTFKQLNSDVSFQKSRPGSWK